MFGAYQNFEYVNTGCEGSGETHSTWARTPPTDFGSVVTTKML